ncbi:MAG TPA: hypothetical protein VK673_14835 [Chthoniobacterales bacterium]|nr:hypothetical protein [Chthoniobacterales bacterium]
MPTRKFYESEALLDSLTESFQELALNTSQCQALIGQLSAEKADRLNDLLVSLLTQPEMQAHLQQHLKDVEVPGPSSGGLGSHLRSQVRQGRIVRVDFFQFGKCWEKTSTSLLGLALALITLNPAGLPVPTYETVRGVWSSWVALKRPGDDVAIDTYEAVLRTQCILLNGRDPGRFPTLVEIQSHAGPRTEREVVTGLTRLRDLGIVKVDFWGDQEGDLSHRENTWRPVV